MLSTKAPIKITRKRFFSLQKLRIVYLSIRTVIIIIGNFKGYHNVNVIVGVSYRWVVDAKEHRVRTTSVGSSVSLGTSPSEGGLATSASSLNVGSIPQSLPSFQHPSHALLKENGFTQQGYTRYRARCLKGIGVDWFVSSSL